MSEPKPTYVCPHCGKGSWQAGGRPVCCHCGKPAPRAARPRKPRRPGPLVCRVPTPAEQAAFAREFPQFCRVLED